MSNHPLSAQEKRDQLRLYRTERIGPITFRQLMRKFGSAEAALRALPELATRGGSKKAPFTPSITKIEDEIAALLKKGGHLIAQSEPDYPEPLKAVDDAPPIFSVLGQPSLLSKKSVGIVGTRNASINGRKMAELLARELGENGYAIASGLARGIDTSAHKASLSTGTIAVVAGGVDVVYPEENRDLYESICEYGLILSEEALGCEPRAQLFPKRNRLISGLSLGVVVVEAAHKSGSLITAHDALDQGREVFAVPGSPLDPRAAGSNSLIKQGAVLVERTEDILTHLQSMKPQCLCERKAPPYEAPSPQEEAGELAQARNEIIENIGFSPVTVDELIRACHFSPSIVLTVLLELELAGRLERQPGQRVVLIA